MHTLCPQVSVGEWRGGSLADVLGGSECGFLVPDFPSSHYGARVPQVSLGVHREGPCRGGRVRACWGCLGASAAEPLRVSFSLPPSVSLSCHQHRLAGARRGCGAEQSILLGFSHSKSASGMQFLGRWQMERNALLHFNE